MEFVGDGDSKAHKLLVEEAVYGDVEVEKLQWAGHVQKCLKLKSSLLEKEAYKESFRGW